MFDATLQVLKITVETVEDGSLQIILFIGFALPVGPGQAMAVPAGVLRIPLNKDAAIEHGNEVLAKANDLPDPPQDSGLVVAQNLQGVDQAAKMDQQMRGQR